MSSLVVEDIIDAGISQEIRLTTNTSLAAIRVHLMRFGTPTGNLILKVKTGATTIQTITTAHSLLNAEIGELYGHGLFKFDLELPIRKNGVYTEYTIELSSSAYDSSNYYAWCKDWFPAKENLYGTGASVLGETSQDTLKPYHLELYEYED